MAIKIQKQKSKSLEILFHILFFLSAVVSLLSVIIIAIFIFISGIPALTEIGLFNFISGIDWSPTSGNYGILPMIVGSVGITVGATVLGVLIGVFTAVYLAEIASKRISSLLRPAINLLSGIPSVVFGFFGLIVIVPIIRNNFGGAGQSLLAGIIVLAIMILPTIISITETSIRSVPREFKEGSLALGATHIETIFKVMVPAAKSGIMTGIILGIGRAIGETMAVILVTGNSVLMPSSITDPIRTLTANIALEMGYSSGLHQNALFATGIILFLFIMILNIILNVFIIRKAGAN